MGNSTFGQTNVTFHKQRQIIIYSAGHKLLRKNLKWEWKKPHLQVFPQEEIPYPTRYLE